MNDSKNFTQIVVCPECFGKGRKRFDPCTVCGGSGRITDTQSRAIEEANAPQDWKLTEAVLVIKIDDLSPIDALTKLYELRRLANEIRK
jgi:RecJ-like exonuclease